MVQFANIGEALQAKRRLAGEEDDLDPVNRALVGNSARIDIPLRDRYIVGKAAEQLRSLADRLDMLSRRGELDETAVLIMAKSEISRACIAIRTAHGNANKNGTFPGGSTAADSRT